jgi:hypothetical protein
LILIGWAVDLYMVIFQKTPYICPYILGDVRRSGKVEHGEGRFHCGAGCQVSVPA